MRSKILVLITAMLIFGVSFAVYAYNSTTTTTDTVAASCCCCSGDSCPMKASGEKAAAGSEHSCCCKGDGASCPMKAKGDKAASGEHSCPMMSGAKHEGMAGHKMPAGAKHEMKADGEGHSCPMMKDGKMAEHHKASGEAHKTMDRSKMDGHTGCSCPCCAAGKEKKEKTAI